MFARNFATSLLVGSYHAIKVTITADQVALTYEI